VTNALCGWALGQSLQYLRMTGEQFALALPGAMRREQLNQLRVHRFIQKIEQKLPLKKIPSTAAKATKRSAKFPLSIQRKAHSAFFFTAGTVSIA
jgi:GGDEF domain-containing protein